MDGEEQGCTGGQPQVLHTRPLIVKGDRLILYTDGVIEAPDAAGGLFGVERLRAVLEETGNKELSELKRTVLAAARRHTYDSLTHDDVTLLAIEIS